VVAEVATDLIGKQWTNDQGETKTLTPSDVIVVAPFNAQVSRIRSRVPDCVLVGTVDNFQGQEGVVAVYSITNSSPEDIPGNFEFLYSRNRLNVAVSRARSYAIVVCNPAMLLPRCRKPEHMRLSECLVSARGARAALVLSLPRLRRRTQQSPIKPR
jgi:superfamily I DNA and/or RNA helicase